MKQLFAILFLVFSLTLFSQNDVSYDNDVRHFIEINGTMGQYQSAIGQLIPMLKEQYKDANVPESEWIEIDVMAQKSLKGLSDDLVVIYKKYFTHNEIIALNKLYEKEVAQKFINNVVNLSDASQEASIVWSKNLYHNITDLLHQKGYTP